ncbi:MAG: hypothetical protein IJR03_01995 [Bacteroidales bacterium]|nr:hypothetical protein [Bacteroidales bacterium]
MDARDVVKRILKELGINVLFCGIAVLIGLLVFPFLWKEINIAIHKDIYTCSVTGEAKQRFDNRFNQASIESGFNAYSLLNSDNIENQIALDKYSYAYERIKNDLLHYVHYGASRFDNGISFDQLYEIGQVRQNYLEWEAEDYGIIVMFILGIGSILGRYITILVNWLNYKQSDNWWLN